MSISPKIVPCDLTVAAIIATSWTAGAESQIRLFSC